MSGFTCTTKLREIFKLVTIEVCWSWSMLSILYHENRLSSRFNPQLSSYGHYAVVEMKRQLYQGRFH